MRSASKTLLTTINTQGSTLTTTMVTLGRQPVTGPEVISGQCMQTKRMATTSTGAQTAAGGELGAVRRKTGDFFWTSWSPQMGWIPS